MVVAKEKEHQSKMVTSKGAVSVNEILLTGGRDCPSQMLTDSRPNDDKILAAISDLNSNVKSQFTKLL